MEQTRGFQLTLQIVLICAAISKGTCIASKQAASHVLDGGIPKPPSFPTSFEAEYTFSLPYVKVVQTKGLSIPVHMWYDGESDRLRVDVYGGLDKTISGKDVSYLLYPRINTTVCDTIGGEVGPTANAPLSNAPLPDISEWQYAGSTVLGNTEAHLWQLYRKQQDKVSSYTFYVSPEGSPLRLYMMGFNIMAGSHFDEYLIDFHSFKPGQIKEDVYGVPEICKKIGPTAGSAGAAAKDKESSSAAAAAAGRFFFGFTLPEWLLAGAARLWGEPAAAVGAATWVDAEAALGHVSLLMPWSFIGTPGNPLSPSNSQGSDSQHDARQKQRAENLAFIRDWNTAAAEAAAGEVSNAGGGKDAVRGPGFRLAPNKFLDWLPEEYGSTATSLRRSSSRDSALDKAVKEGKVTKIDLGEPKLKPEHLPKHLDWRGTGADNVVKDQATCGSCWAFATTGTMQGAWYLTTGQILSLSEQQLVDCSWDYGNNGCGGGNMEPALAYVAKHGGAMSEEDYQYLGQNAFCGSNATRKDAAPSAFFTGYGHVKKRSKHALMEALLQHGPVAISLDASQPTFKFYSEGVYSDKHCLVKRDELDHAVLVVGYGTDSTTGEEYWLVKNSWSKYWGEDGFIRMARTGGSGNDCGISSDPVVALVDEGAVEQRMSPQQVRAVYAAATGGEWEHMEEVLAAWGRV